MNIKERIKSLDIFFIVVGILIIKTFLVHVFYFNLEIKTFTQMVIMLFAMTTSMLFYNGISLLFSSRVRHIMLFVGVVVLTGLLYGNVLYYRFFNDFVTIPVFFQTSNMGDLGGSIWALLEWKDIFVFVDLIFIWFFIRRNKQKIADFKKKSIRFVLLACVVTGAINLLLAETERPELLTRTFDRKILVKNLGLYNYLVYDVVLQTKTYAQRSMAKTETLTEAKEYIEKQKVKPNEKMTGIAKGKNVILISLESTQSFVFNRKIDGQEVTPFLNSLIRNNEIFYFDNLYHQTAQGKTSDAEFIMDNSLYPLPRGAVYFTNSQNKYEATPKILKENGYYPAVFHANNKSFWNRDVMYKNLGYEKYFDKESYDVNDANSVNWGLKDIPFFEQSVPYLQNLKQPFYSKMLMLTNHYPFSMAEEDRMMEEYDTSSQTVNRYFPTVRYSDEALKKFFEDLKKAGLYDNSVIVIYGDHYGISDNHNKAMSKVTGQKITPFEHTQLQRTPLFIHIPGVKGETIHKVSGQIDVRPTILNLLGITPKNDIRFGNDLFSEDRQSLAILRDGSFVTDKNVWTNGVCYSKDFGEAVDSSFCAKPKEKAKNDLKYSDKIIYGDLLRFLE